MIELEGHIVHPGRIEGIGLKGTKRSQCRSLRNGIPVTIGAAGITWLAVGKVGRDKPIAQTRVSAIDDIERSIKIFIE